MFDKHPLVLTAGTHQQISEKVFRDLKETGVAHIVLHTNAVMDGKQLRFQGDLGITLRRSDHGDAKDRVIVNGELTDLPVVTADGTPASGKSTLKFAALDDPAFPPVLGWDWSGESNTNKIVKITFPVQKLEQELKEQGRAEIYGIYFDFDSDEIRSESEPVLAEIAEVLKKEPDWKLSVEGHTDNVGGDKHNLDLSQRRAASVIAALTTRYQISADRLSPAGFGASKPKATNDTVEGRALNRRVELVRK
jgi:outer membrane protein OmpA-like peptidoglycan-associated protein